MVEYLCQNLRLWFICKKFWVGCEIFGWNIDADQFHQTIYNFSGNWDPATEITDMSTKIHFTLINCWNTPLWVEGPEIILYHDIFWHLGYFFEILQHFSKTWPLFKIWTKFWTNVAKLEKNQPGIKKCLDHF